MPKSIERPSDYTYAQLAEKAYAPGGGDNLPENWSVLEYCDKTKDDGYFGVAYQHQGTKQIIIAHRGTELPKLPHNTTANQEKGWAQAIKNTFSYLSQIPDTVKDIEADIDGIIRCTIASQQITALEFSLSLYAKYPDAAFSFTGHSLGGWLAQLCTYHFMTENKYTWCVTFDNPGARDIIEEIHPRYLDNARRSQLGTFLDRLDITTYLSSPNLINSCNQHLGTVYRLHIPFSQPSDWYNKTIGKLSYTIHSHQIKNLIEQFDPQTGFAKKLSCVNDWPCIQWNESKKFDTEGPITTVVKATNNATLRLPDFVVTNVSKRLDKGLMKLINSTSLTRGFYKIAQVVSDYATNSLDKQEYDGFFQFADASNQYEPSHDLSFKDHYTLNHKYHYDARPYQTNYLHLRHVNRELREFLWAYAQQNQDDLLSRINDPNDKQSIQHDLKAYQLVTNGLIEKKGWALTLLIKTDNAFEWRSQMLEYFKKYPVLLQYTQDARAQAARLYELAITVDQISGKITYVEEQQEALTHRINAMEQSHRYHALSEEEIKHLANQAKAHLKERYIAKEEIAGLFGQPLKLEGQYINVQILYQNQKEEKKENEDKIKNNSKEFHDARMSSYEDLHGKKVALPLEKLFLPAKDILSAEQKTSEQDITKPPRFLLIQGRAGIGKTTMVEYVVRQWAQDKLFSEFNWVFNLRLRDLRNPQAVEASKKGQVWELSDWIYNTHFAGKMAAIDFKTLWQREIEPNLEKNVLFILDGYDETPEAHPCKQALMALNAPSIHKIITSRPYGTSDLPSNRRDLEVVGFVDENIEQYIKFYFAQTPDKATQILAELRKNIDLWRNAHIPVTLNILCGILEKNTDITIALNNLNSMSGLYEAMEVALLERAYRQNVDANTFKHNLTFKARAQIVHEHYASLRQNLSVLAYQAFSNQQLVISQERLEEGLMACKIKPQDFSATIQQLLSLGLLKPVLGEGQMSHDPIGYEFLHLTFNEYYAAQTLANKFIEAKDENDTILTFIHAIKFDPRYQIVFWFTAGLLNKYPEAFARLMRLIDSKIHDDVIGHVKLSLQLRCVHEAWEAAQTTDWLPKIAKMLQEKLELFERQVKEKLLRRKDNFILHTIPAWVLSLKISPRWLCASGDLDPFLNIKIPIISRQIKSTASFIAWLGLESPKTLHILLTLLKNEKDQPEIFEIVAAINQLGDVAAAPDILAELPSVILLSSKNNYLHNKVNNIISSIGALVATPKFFEGLAILLKQNNPNIRDAAFEAISYLKLLDATDDFLATMKPLLQSTYWLERASAAWAISCCDTIAANPDILAILITLLGDANEHVRSAAAFAIGNFSTTATSADILAAFTILLKHGDDWQFSHWIHKHSTSVAKPEIIALLEHSLKDDNKIPLISTIRAIGAFGASAATKNILIALIFLLKNEDRDIRCHATNAIGVLGVSAAVPRVLSLLLTLLQDKESEVRSAAATAISNLAIASLEPEFLIAFLSLLHNEDHNVRYHAVSVISKLDPKVITAEFLAAFPVLLQHTKDEVKCSALNAIGKIGITAATPAVITALPALLNSNNNKIQSAAIQATGELGTAVAKPDILSVLAVLLKHKNYDVRENVCEVIGKLGAPAAHHEILKSLATLLPASTNAWNAIARLGAAAATPEILKAIWSLLNRWDYNDYLISNEENAALYALCSFGASAATPEILKILAHIASFYPDNQPDNYYKKNEKQAAAIWVLSKLIPCYLETKKNIADLNFKEVSLALLIGSYYAGNVHGGLIWQSDQTRYCWQGRAGATAFSLQLTPEQALWFAYMIPKVIQILEDEKLDLSDLRLLLKFPSWKLPILKPESTSAPTLMQYNNATVATTLNSSSPASGRQIERGISRSGMKITFDFRILDQDRKKGILSLLEKWHRSYEESEVVRAPNGEVIMLTAAFNLEDIIDEFQNQLSSSRSKCTMM